MIQQSNLKLTGALSSCSSQKQNRKTNARRQERDVRTTVDANERISLISSYHARKQVQETNINTTSIDIREKSSSHCSLAETSLNDRVEKQLEQNTHRNRTEENLGKLQQITDDVRLLTKQLHLSIATNRNNHAAPSILDERLLGEICYQLERRILVLIFTNSKHFYGYSLRSLASLIGNEADLENRKKYQQRFVRIERYLHQSHFDFPRHSLLTFDLINQHGIYPDYTWLQNNAALQSDSTELKSLCSSMSKRAMHADLSILIDSLQLISKHDGHPLFYW